MSFTIKELEALSGIKAHTIRIWEQRYGFLKPSRTTTNIRTYSNDELKTILMVALLNKHGYKISRISNMAPQQRRQEVLALNTAEAINEQLVNELISCMVDMDATGFETILNNYLQAHDVLAMHTSLIFPFLDKTGLLWQASRINPAHEHLATAIIRQKIISALDRLPLPQVEQPLFLMLLPEDEHHELGLLLVYYLLKQRGLPVLYLGASVPLKDAAYVCSLKSPRYLYLHLTTAPTRLGLQKYLQALAEVAGTNIIVSGAAVAAYKKAWPPAVRPVTSFPELNAFLDSVQTI